MYTLAHTREHFATSEMPAPESLPAVLSCFCIGGVSSLIATVVSRHLPRNTLLQGLVSHLLFLLYLLAWQTTSRVRGKKDRSGVQK